MPCGVFATESARIASAIPGASRSSTLAVASGVTSRGPSPVPPVVRTSLASPASSSIASAIASRSSGTTRRTTSKPSAAQQLLEQVAARVLALAHVDAVGDRQHRRLHAGSFVFSTSRTSESSIPSSTAFAMS